MLTSVPTHSIMTVFRREDFRHNPARLIPANTNPPAAIGQAKRAPIAGPDSHPRIGAVTNTKSDISDSLKTGTTLRNAFASRPGR